MSSPTFNNLITGYKPSDFMMSNTVHQDVSYSSSGSFEDSPTRVKSAWGKSNRASFSSSGSFEDSPTRVKGAWGKSNRASSPTSSFSPSGSFEDSPTRVKGAWGKSNRASFSSIGSFEDSPTRVKGENPWGKSTTRASSPTYDVSNRENNGHLYSSVGFQMPQPSSIVALDCEMVGTGRNGERSSLARVTLIDWEGNALIDTYVVQKLPVTDYRTFISGITKENLDGASMTVEQCREQVSRLLYNRILVGHGLKNDLDVLGINQPWWLTRDTATYLPFMKKRVNNLAWWPRKLKELACEKLEREIQVFGKPHSPIEDALAALDLYKTVQSEWEKEIYSSLMKTNKFKQQHATDQRMALMQRHNQNMYRGHHYNNNHYRQNYYPRRHPQTYYYVPKQQLVQ